MHESARDEAIRFLYDRINYEGFRAMPYGADHLRLERMRRLLDLLGRPDAGVRVVHIAGTKGKGSTSAMLGAILQAAGYRVGVFQSPHLERVEERFLHNGQPIAESRFLALIEQIRPAVKAMERESDQAAPTFFEITTAIAWLYFVAEQVDIAILEVGLGGRLDSTNVCDPLVCAITSIGRDHVEQLGSSLVAIAREKAGIAKRGVPLVSGVRQPGPRDAIAAICRDVGARLCQVTDAFEILVRDPVGPFDGGGARTGFDFHWKAEHPPAEVLYDLRARMLGRHQANNAAIAVALIELLRLQGLTIDESAIRLGLSEARCPARVEVLRSRPTVVLDAAHNAVSIGALVATLDSHFPQKVESRHLIVAATLDKDWEEMASILAPRFGRITVTQYTTSPRAVPAAQLAAAFRAVGGRRHACEMINDPRQAYREVVRSATPEDLVCVTGSFYLAGELRSYILNGGDQDAIVTKS